MTIRFPVTISPTGTITATIEPVDVPVAFGAVVSAFREVGDRVVVDAPCVSPDEVERMAMALAGVLLGRAR